MTTSALATWINHHLQGDPSFLGAVVPGDPSCSLPGTGCSHTLNGFDHQRSGQIWLHFRPGCLPEMFRKGGTTHGTCYHYDTHVPFLLMAPNLEPGKETNPAKITDIAPTICDILGIMHPSGCTGQSLLQK
jgi:arylsulfatase A-like enzyme